MTVQPAYTQSPPQHQMIHAQPLPAHRPNITMSNPVGNRVSIKYNEFQLKLRHNMEVLFLHPYSLR